MFTHTDSIEFFVLIMGSIILLSILIRNFVRRIGIPPLVGYMLLGFIVRLVNIPSNFLSESTYEIFEFLGTIGIIFLLFRVGLSSNIGGLIRQLKRSTVIWLGNIIISGILGFVAAKYLLGLELVPSMFVTIALTATSVAVSVGTWQEAKALESPLGELLVDSAEMDDISGVILMALLFSVAPLVQGGSGVTLLPVILTTLGIFLLKLIGFGAVCYFFSRYVESPISHYFQKMRTGLQSYQFIFLIGVALVISAVAGLIGFSVAIGAFFAGLAFSRDLESYQEKSRKASRLAILYQLFPPFFFINIGLNVDPTVLSSSIYIGLVLLVFAIVGKILGNGLPALFSTKWTGALLLGTSMIPRAEMAMVIMHQGLLLGDWAVPTSLYSGMVLVSLVTAIISPVIIRSMLKKWPQNSILINDAPM
ncbi:cation:proton antiporter [Chloroflexota bacterium]